MEKRATYTSKNFDISTIYIYLLQYLGSLSRCTSIEAWSNYNATHSGSDKYTDHMCDKYHAPILRDD